MKKALSLLMSVLMLFSLVSVPVYAGADDGFNDGEFEWCNHEDGCQLPTCTEDGYCNVYQEPIPATGHVYDDDADTVCNVCGEERPGEPEEPTEGTQTNPFEVPMPAMFPEEVVLPANTTIYYNFPAMKFDGWTIFGGLGLPAISLNGVVTDTPDPASRSVKVTLGEFGGLIGFINNTDEEMTINPYCEEPIGTQNSPLNLQDGANAITIPENTYDYYVQYTPTVDGAEYTFTVDDPENFDVQWDEDGDPATYMDRTSLSNQPDGTMVLTCESYVNVLFVITRNAELSDLSITVTAPAKGSEVNPYWLSYDEMADGLEGDGLWPASTDGVWYNLNGDLDGNTLLVTGACPLTVTVNGTGYTADYEGEEATLEIPLELGDNDSFKTKIQSSAPVTMDMVFPVGHENNPQPLNKGKNTLPLSETGDAYYATYVAEKDGVLKLTPNTVDGLGYTDATNITSGDYENGYDFIFAGYELEPGVIEGASSDNVLTVTVSEGDVVRVSACAGENEDFETLAMDLVLTVSYEGENVATITAESATACYAQMGDKASATVTATGDGLKYTWYFRNVTGTKYSKSSVTSATYSTTMSDKSKGRRIYCVVTDQYGNTAKSKTFLLRESVSITSVPSTARYAKEGSKVTVKIGASGDGLKYTWYFRNVTGTKYSKSSVTSATYSTTMSDKVKGRRVYCVVTDKYGKKVTSKTFLLRESVSIVKTPSTATYAKNGATAKVTIKASGDGLKYTWYIKNAGGTKYSKSSITKATYSVKMSNKVNGRRLYCVVTDKYGNVVQTKTMILKKK